jgi:Zn-dependent protease
VTTEIPPAGGDEPIGYAAAVEALLRPAPFHAGALLLIGTLALFLLAQSADGSSISTIGILVGVLLFHELGHFAGMKVFGYRDVRMFFIPFLGAAVSGRQVGVAAWKEGVVSLLGPIPGILLGTAIAVAVAIARPANPLLRELAAILIGLNAFNLLPLGALDGGRLFQRILFSRHRLLEVAFQAITGVLLAVLAVMGESWALGIFAYIVVMSVPRRYRILERAGDLRRLHEGLSPDPAELDEAERRALYMEALAVVPARFHGHARTLAQTMREILDATRPAPSMLASAGLLVAWGAALGVSVIGAKAIFAVAGP